MQVGTPQEVYERPRSRFVADFIGIANILPRRSTGATARPCARRRREPGLVLSAPDCGGVAEGASVWLAVRPENIASRARPPEPRARHRRRAAYAGDVSRYAVDLGGRVLRVAGPTARATRRRGRRAAMRSSCAGRRRPAWCSPDDALERQRRLARHALVIGLPYVWLVLFFALPFVLVLAISIGGRQQRAALRRAAGAAELDARLLRLLLGDASMSRPPQLHPHRRHLDRDLLLHRLSHGLCHRPRTAEPAQLLLMLVILPFWTSFLIRVYAWMILLRPTGLIDVRAVLGWQSSPSR